MKIVYYNNNILVIETLKGHSYGIKEKNGILSIVDNEKEKKIFEYID